MLPGSSPNSIYCPLGARAGSPGTRYPGAVRKDRAMQRRRFSREGAEFGRGLGFFDAIYGFAITLLVANIELPPEEEWASLSTLLGHGFGTQLLGFAISFVVIAAFWRYNTELLSRFSGIDQAVITANLFSAGLIVLLPFTTQGISEYSDSPLPVALYACNVALAILAQAVTLEVGRFRGLLAELVTPATIRAEWIDSLAKVAVFAVSIPVAYLVSPGWGMTVWLLLAVVGPVTGRWSARVAERERERERGDRSGAPRA